MTVNGPSEDMTACLDGSSQSSIASSVVVSEPSGEVIDSKSLSPPMVYTPQLEKCLSCSGTDSAALSGST